MHRSFKLGIDVRDLRLASTGTKTYLEEFINALSKTDIQVIKLDTIWKPYWGYSKWGKAIEHIQFFIWKQITLPIKSFFLGIDVLFCSDYYVPLIKLKAKHVVVFHDALFFDHPEYYNPLWLKIFRSIALPAARRADVIIAPSEFSKNRLIQHEPLFSRNIRVVHQGAKSFLAKTPMPSNASLLAKAKLGNLPYFLHVGVLEKRKNLPFLIESFAAFREKHDACLVLIGKPNPKIFNNSYDEVMQAVHHHKLEKYVIFTGYLPDEDLPSWYEQALGYIFPSHYEGFGIPILEAFRFGTPVAVANNSSLPEIGGDAVLTFSPNDHESLLQCMHAIYDGAELRLEWADKGNQRLQSFTWNKSAKEILHICSETLISSNAT